MNIQPAQAKRTDNTGSPDMSTTPRPVFVYGTLCAMRLLTWVLMGDGRKIADVEPLAHRARVSGYARFALKDGDFPAAIERNDPNSSVDGYLLRLETSSQREKLDEFEGELYRPVLVMVTLLDADGQPKSPSETVEADMYVWDGEMQDVSALPWDLEAFVRDELSNWTELFHEPESIQYP